MRDLVWDFRLERVRSINASGHETGLAPLGCGWAIWRERSDVPEELVFDVNHLGGDEPSLNLNFSRSGAPVVAQYYELLRLGRRGFEGVQRACYDVAGRVARGVAAAGPFELLFDGDARRGATVVSWRLADGPHGFNLFDVADRLRAFGWLVPAYTLPPEREDPAVQRVVVRHGFSVEMADALLADLRRALDHLRRHPPGVSLSQREAGGFSHHARARRP